MSKQSTDLIFKQMRGYLDREIAAALKAYNSAVENKSPDMNALHFRYKLALSMLEHWERREAEESMASLAAFFEQEFDRIDALLRRATDIVQALDPRETERVTHAEIDSYLMLLENLMAPQK